MKCIHKERTEIGFAVHVLFTPENVTKNPLCLGNSTFFPRHESQNSHLTLAYCSIMPVIEPGRGLTPWETPVMPQKIV